MGASCFCNLGMPAIGFSPLDNTHILLHDHNEDEVVKLSPHAHSIRDLEDEELWSVSYGMSHMQFILMVAASSLGEELFYRFTVRVCFRTSVPELYRICLDICTRNDVLVICRHEFYHHLFHFLKHSQLYLTLSLLVLSIMSLPLLKILSILLCRFYNLAQVVKI
ncbi:unnamed protein product [Vicia faba]|uniref:Uncharacterized protein n=1 Tax=Vicia faba TaxID=3906 RepID=A0AAV0YHB2_VICFA|nr:unnamed protein product [Vicia faba]